MIKFCPYCSSKLSSDTRTSELRFICLACNEHFKSEPADSLRVTKHHETNETGGKYDVLEENAPYDTAGNKVNEECPQCKFPYLTHIYVGENMVSKYVCSCGYNVLSRSITTSEKTKKNEKPQTSEK